MSRGEIVILAVAYTLVMLVAVQFVDWPGRVGIILALGNVWFWMGRLSCTPRNSEDPA